ncbi:glycoside hydrolase family 3 C-terminal domain-containing protein [Carboxylicivirga sp. M1479]|uniref:glycoside hydrolase family 3 C-terminal domain-containing protein n=1 Tax=Carboxylicivirga sp. M1479 TaxID=2594476 RepID=UPI001178317B|nr:glycoside hydrolase family 3 C-terminal domain-containing protein [Carboxylicivirga sp. M1479]TRX65715.1 glycosyl hydrolase [Carboxylicivirga sp. M1479]
MKKLLISLLLFVAIQQPYSQSADQRIATLLASMTLDEKIHQLTHNTFFTTGDDEKHGIPGFIMSDGPHGVRFGGACSFPVGIAMASSFNTHLIQDVGKAMGEEFWAYGKHQQLGPCIDLCRDPRNGRSAETAGEDPYLSGKVGAAYVRGIQETPVIATVKHLNLVNKQDYRHSSNVTINDRWLHEHYGENFKRTIQEGGALSVMNSYNLINGLHSSENKLLLSTILRERWGYPFYVVSDWGAVHNAERAIEAGTDVCMASDHYVNDLAKLLNAGLITQEHIDNAVRRVLKTKMLSGMMDQYPRTPDGLINSDEHRALCLQAGRESLILLKNKDQILPLNKNNITKIAVVGPNANEMQLDGFGSSWVDVIESVSPLQGIQNEVGASKVIYAKGCDINSTDKSGFANAVTAASQADYVIFIGGLDDTQEGEGYDYGGDRKSGSVDLPGVQQELINHLAAANANMVVMINSGGICAINQSINNIKGLVYAFYPGQEGGTAMADVLFGNYNPAGRLPVTMPKNDGQIQPQNDNFNDDYGCGYRWYDEQQLTPEFAFGHGLSYTTFAYSNIQLSANQTSGEPIQVTCTISNTGTRDGDEVPQLYVSANNDDIWMPVKQLKGFKRVSLGAGESRELKFELAAEDFYYWNTTNQAYELYDGAYTIHIGGASDNLPLSASLQLNANNSKPDLSLSRMYQYPRYPLQGDQVYLYALIQNTGTAVFDPSEASTIEYTIDGQTHSSSQNIGPIPVGGMSLVPLAVPWQANESGNVEMNVSVSINQSVAELDASNNTQSHVFNVLDKAEWESNVNLAYKKPCVASSSEASDLGGDKAVDGSLNTRWSSAFMDPQTLTVDLQGLYDVSTVVINWETAHALAYKIEMSVDGTTWTPFANESNSNGGKDVHQQEPVITARYVRLTGTRRATEWGYSIYELEVFGLKNAASSIVDITKVKLQVYPNPAKDKIYLDACLGEKLSLFDVNGHLLREIDQFKGELLVSDLPGGLYFLYCKSGMAQFVKE